MHRKHGADLMAARAAARLAASTLVRGSLASHRRLLGLPAGNHDPVRIILAAQLRLRRWRRAHVPGGQRVESSLAQSEIRRLIAAREALLRSSAP